MKATSILQYPLSNEKAIRMMESENKLVFVVDRSASKFDVKRSIEEVFNVHVTKVNTFITPKGEKRAYVRLDDEHPAIDIMTQLGLM